MVLFFRTLTFRYLTVKENIVLPLSLSKVNLKEIKKRLKEVSEGLGIDDILNKYPYEISGGQKQRTAAARAYYWKACLDSCR